MVFEFMDLLGAVGGVPEALNHMARFSCGSFLMFHAAIMNMGKLYIVKKPKKDRKEGERLDNPED